MRYFLPSLRAKRSNPSSRERSWIASSLSLLAMTTLRHRPQFLRRLPVAPEVVRHLDVGRAQEREGVVDGVGERRHAADIRAFADALGADRMMRRRGDGEVGLPM